MSNERKQLVESILAVLSESASPLKAREISDALNQRGLAVTKTAVNSVLYAELTSTKAVVQDSQYCWTFVNGQTNSSDTGDNAESAGGEQSHSEATALSRTADPEECRAARRVLQTLRSGTTSCNASKAISVGTARIEQELQARINSLFEGDAKADLVVIAADWGFGKSHMRTLLSSHLIDRGIPFLHECVDGRAASLAHIHRSVPRWLERTQIGRTCGLRDAFNTGRISPERALAWARTNHSDFAYGLRWGLGGNEWGWLQALGHLYRSPDYPYQHPKAMALVESIATFLHKMECGGLVLLLDEAENIDKQYDIRGRRKSYETLARMMRHPNILPVVFVTDRLLYQVEQDFSAGRAQGWGNWSPEAKSFVRRFREIEPLRPPRMTDRLALELVTSIQTLYSVAYPSELEFSAPSVVDHWRRTPTKSVRLLVRLTISELDLLVQNKGLP
jgi:hypothetical protein